MKIDERHLFLRRQRAHRFHIRRLCGLDRPVRIEDASHQRRDENRCRADGAGLVDITRHEGAICRAWIGLALWALSRFVVVAELNKVVLTVGSKRLVPESLVDEALRAATIRRDIDDLSFVRRKPAKTGSPA